MEYTEKKLEEMLRCPVCQDIFKDPHQLPCGHSMCMGCLENMRDHSSDMPFRCPDCRRFFGFAIGLQKSYTLTNITENFRESKKRKDKQTKNVFCDYCVTEKNPAFKTCLKCEVALCKEHIKDHMELPVFTGHPLVKPLGDLSERKCPQHEDAVLRYYCNASGRYICNMCALESKKQNMSTEASNVIRRQLTEYMDLRFETLKLQMTETNKSVKKLQEQLRHAKLNSSDSLINSVTMVLLFLWFIVLYYAYNYSVENKMLTAALDKQQNRVHHIYSTIAELLAESPVKSQKHLLTEAIHILDVDTASPFLGVSADLRTAERVKTRLNYPASKSRFDEAPQVLSERCFSTGTHIWEVEAEGYWDIAVSYKSIQRKNNNSPFGKNALSWSLTHDGKGKLLAYHNREKKVVSATLKSNRIAVMVDFGKGNITFSSMESTITRLHEFKAELTEPVCLGFGLYKLDPLSRATIVNSS
ncbi:E3 ubiquitin-protein ligase TRIM47-like [Acanthopagrus latus]|uniref:E3 ubiquitin-protein ligase TRIM47-like n=1 Tax=Acanthopagrus latus TaxID=8177 RepID=UPI00187BE1C8|nr:E3 ubiquitin-protein ligase TRIM47-like [Acanthopagrus latus]XP_036939931.1 E3 ubiquitin-protein ligase TRIM47-like [Acanthopagrus latus]